MMREEEERVVPSKKLLLLILVFFCGERETEKYSIEKRSSKKEHTPTEEYDASSGENFSLFLFLLARRRRRKSFGG